jgi:hypothetical protein
MKLHAGTHNVEKYGNFEESKFSIEASSKAFFILSDGLYSNKILAVVRELSTNAYDSHVEAGKAHIPFDVHLPTHLAPIFFIRDYGTSMSHEDCMQLYTTYFRSTRNNSNDAVGCLGLGSKAPFAYADSFTVEAFMNGKKRLYTGYKDENGSPVFSLMDESDTTEQDGIKVSINVQSHDINKFVAEAHAVYDFFKVRPNFVGASLSFAAPKKVLEGDNWYFDDDNYDNLIIMGQIAYPLASHQFRDQDTNKQAQFIDYSNGLRIFVDIGDVDITPSRESLSYSKETKKNIANRIDSIIAEITNKIENEIKTQPTLFKARMKYVQINDQCSSIKNAVESLQKSIMWNDTKLFDNVGVESLDIKNKINCKLLYKPVYRSKITTDNSVETIHFTNHAVFVVDDIPRGGLGRIKQYIKENDISHSSFYIYKLNSFESTDNCHFYDILGGATRDDILFTSSLPKVEYNRSSSGTSSGLPGIQAQVFNEEKGKFEPCSMSVKYENAHYFTEFKGEVNIGNSSMTIHEFELVMSWVHDNYSDMVDEINFYLVKPSTITNRKLDERSNWKNGNNIFSTIFSDAVNKHRDDIIQIHTHCRLSTERHERWSDIFEETTTNNRAKQIISEYNEFVEKQSAIKYHMMMIQKIAKMLPDVKEVDYVSIEDANNQFHKEFDKEMKKYPLLKILNKPWSDEDKQLIVDYIDDIERNNTLINQI